MASKKESKRALKEATSTGKSSTNKLDEFKKQYAALEKCVKKLKWPLVKICDDKSYKKLLIPPQDINIVNTTNNLPPSAQVTHFPDNNLRLEEERLLLVYEYLWRFIKIPHHFVCAVA